MICAHEPTVDPRIRWEAEFAADRFAVTVLGFKEPGSFAPDFERVNGYDIVRRQRMDLSSGYFLWRLKDVISRPVLIALAIVAVLLYALVVAAEVVFRALRALERVLLGVLKQPWAPVTLSVPLLLLKDLKARAGRGVMRQRFHYVLALLRTQFSPATAIFWKYIKEAGEKPDVVHCNDLDTLLVGALAKQTLKCRVIYDAHEFFPVADSLCRWLDTTFFSIVERNLIRKADAVVTVNPLLAEAMRKAYRLARVYSVPNVEIWDESRPPPEQNSRMATLAAGRVKFLFQGRFTLARGIEEIIRAWSLVDGTRAALFLRGPDNMWRKAAMDLAAQFGLLDTSIYFLDAVAEDMLVSAAAEADVGIIPYLPLAINERLSCPNKLSQYLHAGLMVITNDLPYVKSIVADARAGLSYTSDDLSTLAAAIELVVNDPKLLRQSRESALRFARENFNWQVHGTTLLRLYAGAVADEPISAGRAGDLDRPAAGAAATRPRGA